MKPSIYYRTALFACLAFGCASPSESQTYQELYSFSGGSDGGVPMGRLTQATDGNFYGTTFYGGNISSNFTAGAGTVFKITADGVLTTLAAFDGITNGQHPYGTLVQATDGDFYGTTLDERLFKVTPVGLLTWTGLGAGNVGDLVQGTNSWLYGANSGLTPYGDDGHGGDLFGVSLDEHSGQLLYSFNYNCCPSNGYYPSGGLTWGNDGNLYGLTGMGAAWGSGAAFGTLYRITLEGQLTTMASFDRGPARYPYDPLLQATDGNFYGVAGGGGSDAGTIFKMTPDGTLTTLASFNVANGQGPNGPLVEGNDGNFYGTTTSYGTNLCGCGTVFKMTPNGVITALVSFSGLSGPFPGANPYSALIQGSDGNLYGTTGNQGTHGSGNVFRIIMPGPQLTSTQVGRQLVLSWRTNYVGFSLKSAADLATANWTDCINPPTISGTRYFVTNTITGAAQFFRLKK